MSAELWALLFIGITTLVIFALVVAQMVQSKSGTSCPTPSSQMSARMMPQRAFGEKGSAPLPQCSDGFVAVIDSSGNASIVAANTFHTTTGIPDGCVVGNNPYPGTSCSCLNTITGRIAVPAGFTTIEVNLTQKLYQDVCMQFPTNSIALQEVDTNIYQLMRVTASGALSPCVEEASSSSGWCGMTPACAYMTPLSKSR